MSLRAESIKAYRQLYRTAYMTAVQCDLPNLEGFLEYVSLRFATHADQNRRRLNDIVAELDRKEKALQTSTPPGSSTRLFRSRKKIDQERRKVMRQYEEYISGKINNVYGLANVLPEAIGNDTLTSFLHLLGSDVGNDAYQLAIEKGFIHYFYFENKRAERNEVEEEATSEYQNRIMQQAVLPYAERLLLLHRTAIGENNPSSNLIYMTPWQVTEAIVGTRSGVTAHHLELGRDHVVLEIDENYNKQIIYICCTRNAEGGSYDWRQEVERVSVSEAEDVRRTLFHSEYLSIAYRLIDLLLTETPLHATRKTTIIGHGVGGAVGLIVGLILSQKGYELTNTISLGAPKALLGTLERYVSTINPIRIVLVGDPLIDLPVSGTEGNLFVHVGEILLLNPPGTATDPMEPEEEGEVEEEESVTAEGLADLLNDETLTADIQPEQKGEEEEQEVAEEDEEDLDALFAEVAARYHAGFLLEHYVHHLSNPTVPLEYAEGDEVWDEGEYSAMQKEAARTQHVSETQAHQQDMKGPL